jgi:hypothetical protein
MAALMKGLAKVPGVQIVHNPWADDDPDDLGDLDDDPVGYCCMGCGHVQDHPGECEMCTGYCVEPYG